jgi:hypothetical protein
MGKRTYGNVDNAPYAYYYSCSYSVGWCVSSPAQILAQTPFFRQCVS